LAAGKSARSNIGWMNLMTDKPIKYSKEELEDPIKGLAKEIKKLRKKFKKLRHSVRAKK